MPDVLLTESGDQLLQEDGAAMLLELRPNPVQLVTLGDNAVRPRRTPGATVTPYVELSRLVAPELGQSP